jgi:beta-glucanase (GH16 family)
MEFLSSEFNAANKSYPVQLVLQSAQSVAAGFNAAGSGNYVIANLPFDPTAGFHEYRIDFVPGRVVFYADGQVLATMRSAAVPTEAGHLILTHWSNGNPLWSGGPPTTNATMTVAYVKSYFNSSQAQRIQAFDSRCQNPQATNAICAIPDQTTPPDPNLPNGNSNTSTFFFSNSDNSSAGQIVYHQGQPRSSHPAWPAILLGFSMLLLSFGFIETC